MCVCYFAFYNNSKFEVTNYVRMNNIKFERFAASVIEENSYNIRTNYNGWDVSYWSDNANIRRKTGRLAFKELKLSSQKKARVGDGRKTTAIIGNTQRNSWTNGIGLK